MAFLGNLLLCYAQEAGSSSSKAVPVREAATIQSSKGNSSLRQQISNNEALKAKQNVAQAEQLRRIEAVKKSTSGKATLVDRQQAREVRTPAPLTPEQNAARIAKMNEFKAAQQSKEKANAAKLGVQPPTSLPKQSLRQQPARPAVTLDKRKVVE